MEIEMRDLTFRLCALLCVALLAIPTHSAVAQPRLEFVDPVVTGAGIRPLLELPGAANRDLRHLVVIDASRQNGFLYVHLAGSGGLPENSQALVTFAAVRGYHVLSLAYPNWPSVGERTGAGGDLLAPGAVRAERLFGVDASPLVDVDPANSVVNRLARLLLHQHANYPLERWDQFLRAGQPNWARIVVGGHSQGAGHAAYLAQEVTLAGALLFGGPGDFVAGVGVASWVFRPLRIPSTALYGFVHAQDPNYTLFQGTQAILGLDQSGPIQNVDVVPLPALRANRLNSTRTDIPNSNFHGAVVVDASLPRAADGRIAYADAWQYMLSGALFRDDFGD